MKDSQEKIKEIHLRRGKYSRSRLAQDSYFKRPAPGRQPRASAAEEVPEQKRIHRRLSRLDKRRIVLLTYGSLTSFRQHVRRTCEVAKIMRLPWTTVRSVTNLFRARGYDLGIFEKRKRSYAIIPPSLTEYLLRPSTLQQWAPFTIGERVEIIRRLAGVSFSKSTLQDFYADHKITYTNGKQVYRAYLTKQPQHDAMRRDFAVLLGNLIKKQVPLIYMDESACNSFTVKKKSWSVQHQVNVHHRDNKRFSVTIYGAISEALQNRVCWMFARSTNQKDYKIFLRRIKQSVKASITEKPVLLIDNAPPHTTKSSIKEAQQHFLLLRNVPHTSDFNSVETLWSLSKNNLEKLLLVNTQNLTQRTFEDLVEQSLKMISQKALAGIIHSNRAAINQYLQI